MFKNYSAYAHGAIVLEDESLARLHIRASVKHNANLSSISKQLVVHFKAPPIWSEETLK